MLSVIFLLATAFLVFRFEHLYTLRWGFGHASFATADLLFWKANAGLIAVSLYTH
jgi:hypothetical protein